MASCLLIVDVQIGFINEFTDHIPALVEKRQESYDYVFATRFYNKDNSFYRSLINWHQMGRDSEEFQLAFLPREDAIIIDKSIYSCVNQNFLNMLAERNIKSVDVCGIETDICVTKCAVDLFEGGVEPRVIETCSASYAGVEAHKNALKTLERFIGKNQIIP